MSTSTVTPPSQVTQPQQQSVRVTIPMHGQFPFKGFWSNYILCTILAVTVASTIGTAIGSTIGFVLGWEIAVASRVKNVRDAYSAPSP